MKPVVEKVSTSLPKLQESIETPDDQQPLIIPTSSTAQEYVMSLLSACLAYMELHPYLTVTYLLTAIIISSLAAYKCKSLKRVCRRRRNNNRRRRKPRTHYYYLNKSSAE